MANRIVYAPQAHGLLITIKPRRGFLGWYLLISTPPFLVVWAGVFVSIAGSIASGDPPALVVAFTVVWLTFWVVGGFFMIYYWLWFAFGAEVVKLAGRSISIKRTIPKLSFGKPFSSVEVSNLRASGLFGGSGYLVWYLNIAFWGLVGGSVVFDYRGKTHRFGIQLQESEAQEVVRRLEEYLPRAA